VRLTNDPRGQVQYGCGVGAVAELQCRRLCRLLQIYITEDARDSLVDAPEFTGRWGCRDWRKADVARELVRVGASERQFPIGDLETINIKANRVDKYYKPRRTLLVRRRCLFKRNLREIYTPKRTYR